MKLDIETRFGLERRMTVQLSEQGFNNAVVEQMQSLGLMPRSTDDSTRADMSHSLELQLDTEDYEKILDGLINVSFEQAVRQSGLRVAGMPVFEVMQTVPNQPFSYSAVFEVFPAIPLPYLKSFKFTQLVAEVSEEDIDRTISVIRRQEAKWSLVARPAQKGDSVIINYHAQVGERSFDGKSMRVELNGDDAVVGFEKGLIGASAGEKLPLELDFPEDHYQLEVAGKAVVFDVEVIQVEAMALPKLDTEFITSHGIESGRLETLRSAIQHNMDAHLQKMIRMKNTLTIFTDILKENPVDVPQALVKEEVTRLTCDPCEEVEGVDSFRHEMDPAMFTELAHDRVARSLLVSELARTNSIELDTEEVRTRLEDLVEEYSDKERIIAWFYEDNVRMAGIESDVLGEQVAYWILDNTQAEKVSTTYSEMMNLTDGIND